MFSSHPSLGNISEQRKLEEETCSTVISEDSRPSHECIFQNFTEIQIFKINFIMTVSASRKTRKNKHWEKI